MKLKFNGFLVLLVVLVAQITFAQERTVSGVVSDNAGMPLPGVSVLVKGTKSGTQTDFDGKYSIKASSNQILIFSFIGMKTQEVVASSTNLNVKMQDDTTLLNEIIVNALGVEVKKNQSASSYSKVKSETLKTTGESSLLRSLSAKASNVNIVSSSGDPGAGAYVQIRGQNTITGNSQPLYVVDGIPLNNDEIGSDVDGVNQQSRMNDVNPNDIADIQIFKGASAAALWGYRAANGLILITTKKGKKGKIEVDISSTYSYDKANVRFKTQDKFGQGTNGVWTRNQANSYGDYIGNRSGASDIFDTSANYFISDNGSLSYPITSKNSRENFNDSNYDSVINNGFSLDNHIGLSGGNENGNFYLGLGNINQEGIIRNSAYERTTLDFSSNSKIGSKTTFKTKFTFSGVNSNRIQQGSNTSGLLLGLYRTPADYNNEDYKGTYYSSTGIPYFNSHRSYRQDQGTFEDDQNPSYNNPLWTTDVQKNPNNVNRYIGGFQLQHEFSKFISILGRFGLDGYSDEKISMFPINSVENSGGGSADESVTDFLQYNADLMALGNFDLIKDKLNFDYTVGINIAHSTFASRGGSYISFLVDSDKFSYDNSIIANRTTFLNREQQKLSAGYFVGTFDYNQTLFATLGGRLETISTLAPNIKSYFYPSVEFGYKFSQQIKSEFLTNGKLRATYGQVAVNPGFGFGSTYYLGATGIEGWGGAYDAAAYNGSFQRSPLKGNDQLKPEIKSEYEVGIELGFFNRLSLNATYYQNKVVDNIIQVNINGSSSFGSLYGNFADIENKGFEIEMNYDIIRNNDLKWNIYANWATNRNEVTRLENTKSQLLNGFAGSSSRGVLNQPLGVLWGGKWDRDVNGNLILDAEGFPTVAAEEGIIGDPNPKWRGAIGTRFSYKGFNLNTLFDASIGGDLWDGTNGALNNFGKSEVSGNILNFPNAVAANSVSDYNGVSGGALGWNNPDGTYSVRGNIQDFGGGPVLLNQSWYQNLGGGFSPVSEQFVKSASWIKLREVSLGYSFRNIKSLERTGLKEISLTITGRNLWLWTEDKTLGQDPETNLTGGSNGRGLQYFNHPNTKSYLASINLKF